MDRRALRERQNDALDRLLSPLSTAEAQGCALRELGTLLADVVDVNNASRTKHGDSNALESWRRLQTSVQSNLLVGLLTWLARTTHELTNYGKRMQDEAREALTLNLIACLGLVSGVLLLHPHSQRMFEQSYNLKILLQIVSYSRSTSLSSPLLAQSSASTFPSPVLLPPSPIPSSGGTEPSIVQHSTATLLALAALDALLCALVDRPRNARAFEEVGGLKEVVKVLKDKTVAQVVRIKAIEILYYYLLPEGHPSPPSSSASSHSRSSSTSSLSTATSFSEAETDPGAPFAVPIHFGNGKTLAHAADGFVPQTPVKPPRPRIDQLSRSSFESPRTPSRRERQRSISPTPLPTPRRNLLRESSCENSRSQSRRFDTTDEEDLTPRASRYRPPHSTSRQPSTDSGYRHIRTGDEKRELFRKVMPNVEALESRFKAMGLGVTVS